MITAERREIDSRRGTRAASAAGALLEPVSPSPQRPRRDVGAQPVVRPQSGARSRPMGQRGPLVVRHVRALGWRSPETLAVLVASFFVSLAAIYVGAYAKVAAAGVEEARLTRASRAADEQKDALLARISELSLASDLQKTAAQMHMVANDPKSEQLLEGVLPATAATASAVTGAPIAADQARP